MDDYMYEDMLDDYVNYISQILCMKIRTRFRSTLYFYNSLSQIWFNQWLL